MKPLLVRVEKAVRCHGLFSPGDTVIVALSGGADSTALLDLLSRLPDYNLRLIVAHVNHCLRGIQSDADEEFCRMTAAGYGVPVEVRRINVKSVAAQYRLNLEDAGRRVRIEFFDELRAVYGASTVALAHHADDQAETVLMRLLRGSGMAGLSGMSYRNSRGYIRPLLEITRPEIEQYLCDCGLTWREDASNSDTVYLRNRIRHQLLPLLEEYNPAIRASLAATASIIGDDEALLGELTERAFTQTCTPGEGKVVCAVDPLRKLAIALRRRVLRQLFRQLAGSLEGVGQCHIDALCDQLDSPRPNSRLDLPLGVVAVREYDRLVVSRAGGAPRPRSAASSKSGFELLITGPGSFPLPGGGSLLVETIDTTIPPIDAHTLSVDLAKNPFPWLVRTFRPGDRMTPLGMGGTKKVKDIFIDRKIPASERRRIPLLWCGDGLLWIGGVCVSESCRIDASSAAPVRVTWRI